MKRYRSYIFLLLLVISVSSTFQLAAQQDQSTPSVSCGDIRDVEMTAGIPYQDTTLAVPAGTKIDLTITPLGNSFNPFIFLLDNGGGEMTRFNTGVAGVAEELINYQLSSSASIIRVFGAPTDFTGLVSEQPINIFMLQSSQKNTYGREYWLKGVGLSYGAYTLSLGCTLRDGTVINPGDTAAAPNTTGGNTNALVPSIFSGTGFPGLPSVDFANAFTNELTLGQPAKSKIPPSGDAVLGYTFDAAANDTLALSFSRLSGNLNLGLVVLSADNKVVFQASLVTSSELTTKFILPSDGTYTIGIFRIDLLPPATPEATAFQLTATLNP